MIQCKKNVKQHQYFVKYEYGEGTDTVNREDG